MNDRIQVAERWWIGEHDVGQLGSDQPSFGVEHAVAEPRGDRLDDRRAGLLDLAGDVVSVDDLGPASREHRADR